MTYSDDQRRSQHAILFQNASQATTEISYGYLHYSWCSAQEESSAQGYPSPKVELFRM